MGMPVGHHLVSTSYHSFSCADIPSGEAFISWRRLGELSTDVLALGLHRDSVCSTVPHFLAECRRRTYAASFHIDKALAALADRPPRILKRFSDFRMPLDLSENELLTTDNVEIDRCRQRLTADGWCKESRYSPATYQRLRYIVAAIREELLEVQFWPIQSDAAEKLK